MNGIKMRNKPDKVYTPEQQEIDLIVKTSLPEAEFKIRAKAEADVMGKKIAEEIKSVLQKYGASLAVWNSKLYVVPGGFNVYSAWNYPPGVVVDLPETGLECQQLNNNYCVMKPFPKKEI